MSFKTSLKLLATTINNVIRETKGSDDEEIRMDAEFRDKYGAIVDDLTNDLSLIVERFADSDFQKLKYQLNNLEKYFQSFEPVKLTLEYHIKDNIFSIATRGWSTLVLDLEMCHSRGTNCYRVICFTKQYNCGRCNLCFYKVARDWVQIFKIDPKSISEHPSKYYESKYLSVDGVIRKLKKHAE